MSDTEIDILIKGKDEASAALKGVGDAVDGLDGAGKKATGAGGGLAGMAGMLGGPMVAGAGLAAGALVGVGTAAFDLAQDMDQAMKTAQAQMGLTEEEAAALKPAIEDLFTAGLVDSATAGAEAIAQARQQLRGMSDEELGGAAAAALRLSNTFGEDYGKTLNTINTLQEQFGLTFDEAANFVTTGFQKGLNSSGDFLDSIGEYSTQFSNGGADAGQFFSVLETGLQGGVLGTDKAADAFKEFGLRVADGSESSAQALNDLGIDSEALWQGMADGTYTTADAFQNVITQLNKVDDPVKRNQIGVALLGTQYEDMGASAVLGLDMSKTSMEDMAGATDKLTSQTSDLGGQWESTKRELLVAIIPVGEELLKLAQEAMPYVKEGATWLAGFLKDNLPAAITATKWTIGPMVDAVILIGTAAQETGEAIQGMIDKVQNLGSSLPTLDSALPDWLRPGSPTPFEIGLKGIANEMGGLIGSELPGLRAGFDIGGEPLIPDIGAATAGAGLATAGGPTINNFNFTIQGSVLTERDLGRVARDAINEEARLNGRGRI